MSIDAATATAAPNRARRLRVAIRYQPFFFQNIQLRLGAAAAISLLECLPPHHWPAGTLRRTIST
jgi:hypothetical protein